MSNLCYVTIKVNGDATEVFKFRQACPGLNPFPAPSKSQIVNRFTPLCFANFVPVPESILQATPDERYGWLTENWGCGHALSNGEARLEQTAADSLTLRFATRWTAPVGVIEAMSARFPRLVFECAYTQESNDHRSFALYQAGDRRPDHRQAHAR